MSRIFSSHLSLFSSYTRQTSLKKVLPLSNSLILRSSLKPVGSIRYNHAAAQQDTFYELLSSVSATLSKKRHNLRSEVSKNVPKVKASPLPRLSTVNKVVDRPVASNLKELQTGKQGESIRYFEKEYKKRYGRFPTLTVRLNTNVYHVVLRHKGKHGSGRDVQATGLTKAEATFNVYTKHARTWGINLLGMQEQTVLKNVDPLLRERLEKIQAFHKLRKKQGKGNLDIIQRYCSLYQVSVPTPTCTLVKPLTITKGKKRPAKNIWEGKIEIAFPPKASGGKEETIISATAISENKKLATKRALEHLAEKIYLSVPRNEQLFMSKQELALIPVVMNLSRPKIAQLESTIESMKSLEPFVNQGTYSRPASNPFSKKEYALHPHHAHHNVAIRPPPQGVIKSTHLPVYSQYAEILKAINENQVTIISGGTGTGKTTQVPQYIIADFLNQLRGSTAVPNVVVTQPRRIAAVSVAQRVAAERDETIGKRSAIGYNVRFENMQPTVPDSEGRVTFCTTGVLLRRLQDDQKLEGVTHILLDEVHERDMNTDFLLMVLRELLEERPDLKLVLMSATAEINLFQNYFRHYGCIGQSKLPQVIEIPGRTFPIKEFYLDDYWTSLSQYNYPLVNSRETRNYASNELRGFTREDADLPLDLMETLISHISLTKGPGAILCFLPGWEEMSKLQRHMVERDIMRVGYGNQSKFKIICLHSSIPIAQQQEAFRKVPPGVRKIVLATNIAETSVTIDDIVYVVDSAKVKEKVFDPSRRITSLSPIFTSQANIRQRTGRAGRCQPGQYFSLISKNHKRSLPRAQVPELLRSDLRSICLHIRAMGFSGSLGSILAKAPNPPRHQSINMAIDNLKSLDALDDNQDLTTLGAVLASLPIDPGFGKMVVLGCIFKCLDPILTVAAALGSKDVFAAPPDYRDELKRVRRRWAQGAQCDALTTVNLVREWEKVKNDWKEEQKFCEHNFVHRIGIRTIFKTKIQLKDILEKSGFMTYSSVSPEENVVEENLVGGPAMNINSNNQGLIRALLTAGMYPNVAESVFGEKNRMRTKTDKVALMHPSSVNYQRKLDETPLITETATEPKETPRDETKLGELFETSKVELKDVFSEEPLPVSEPEIVDNESSELIKEEELSPNESKYFAFHERFMTETLFLRGTTKIDPLSLVLFGRLADSHNIIGSDHNPDEVKSTNSEGQLVEPEVKPRLPPATSFVIDDWVRLGVNDPEEKRVLEETRAWLDRYLGYVYSLPPHQRRQFLSSANALTSEVKPQTALAKEFIQNISDILATPSV
ncbi:hypothetical protein K7432_006837 [Basidiobolus ranarum]|uniref:RNA helicase n=1 Tax=Basidiobolus ranarum TaxID=34480 RepID=A0ABR2WU81_9FUNG